MENKWMTTIHSNINANKCLIQGLQKNDQPASLPDIYIYGSRQFKKKKIGSLWKKFENHCLKQPPKL